MQYRQHRFTRPAGATELLLVRHGESQPAVEGQDFPLVDGHGDPALAPEGRVQAEQVAERLADQQLDAIYVTTLRRTVETAAPLVARVGIEPIVEADLREVSLGEWEGGVMRKHFAEGHPLARQAYSEERWELIPGAESSEAFSARIAAGLGRIVAAHPDERVAVFSHGGAIGEILRQVAGGGRAWTFVGSDNGAISHVVVDGKRSYLRRFNDTSHLQSGFDLGDSSGS